MLQTIQVSSCVSVHGELVEVLRNGDMIVRSGDSTYRGRPLGEGWVLRRRPGERGSAHLWQVSPSTSA
jgi:hypothetical protein